MNKWKKWLIGEWSWTRPLKSIAFIYLALLVVACAFPNKFIFQPPPPGYELEDRNMLQTSGSNDSTVAMYYRKAAPGMPTILWSHGNAEDIGHLHDRLCTFNSQGYGVLTYDYPGYGHSSGSPNEQGCYDAISAAYSYLTSELKVPTTEIIIYGQSVGSGPSVWLASQKPAAGIILVSPFVSAFRTVTRIPLFPGDKFKNIKRISDIEAPLLVIHGDKDRVIKQWHGKKLYEMHSGKKTFVSIEGAGHNDLYVLATEDILSAIKEFTSETVLQKQSDN